MQIIRNRQIVPDTWRHAPEAGTLPAGDVTVPLARWKLERNALLERDGRIGVRLASADSVGELVPDLAHLALVALEFGQFADGRGYSQARLLRSRHRYQGEIRAIGDVQRDQLLFLWRCGVDTFELRAGKDIRDALNAFTELSVAYQPDSERPASWRRVRFGRPQAAE